MDTFAAMALSSLPADKTVLFDKPRNPNSHIIDKQMIRTIVGFGLLFFVLLSGLWQLLWHTDIKSVSQLINLDSLRLFFTGMFDLKSNKGQLSGYDHGVFFSIFVMLQFWNLFNAKYFRTDRSLIQDAIDFFKRRDKVRQSYSQGFIWIVLVILLGQILIVSFAGSMFNVEHLNWIDWTLILLLTSPVLIVADIVRFIKNMIKE